MAASCAFGIQLDSIQSGFDGETCWVHARAGAIPGAGDSGGPAVVVTTQKLLLSGSDVFYTIHDTRSADMGQSWSELAPHPGLGRWSEPDGVEAAVCDFTPQWHAATGKLLGTGHVARYSENAIMHVRPNQPSYSVYDADARTWSDARVVELPQPKFFTSGSGSGQRHDLNDGTVLLPCYFRPDAEETMYQATVLRCSFNGAELVFEEHGTALACPDPRGMCEPSLTRFGEKFFLTLRNDVRGYVTRGSDGLHFDDPVPWCFDDGEELGNYNTQQHWVTHSDALFLTYTRRGADNDHVFRNRAPLFIAQIDPERLCVIRETEQIAIPERGARLGNYGVCDVSPEETWIVNAEWMQPAGCEKYGSDNTIWISRLVWDTPNQLAL